MAVVGTAPARVAGRLLPRLLRGALVAIGLSALAWLASLLIGSGTASAEPAQPSQSASTGLLGGLLGTVAGVLNAAVPPISAPLPDAPRAIEQPMPPPQPTPVIETPPPAPAKSIPHTTVPVERPVPVATPSPPPAPPTPPAKIKRHAPVAATPSPAAVVRLTAPPAGSERADPSTPDRAPVKAPSAPAAPALPTSGASAGHDGPGQARSSHGVLPGDPALEPPAEAFVTHSRAGDAGDRAAGQPAASPD